MGLVVVVVVMVAMAMMAAAVIIIVIVTIIIVVITIATAASTADFFQFLLIKINCYIFLCLFALVAESEKTHDCAPFLLCCQTT
jgi:hypothetical protein